MKPRRAISLVRASIIAAIGVGLLAAGAILGWAYGTHRDDAGFFTTPNERFETDSYALTSDEVDLGQPGRDDWLADRDLATVRITVENADARPLFVGIGRAHDVEAYRAGIPHDDITDVNFLDSRSTTARRTWVGPSRQHLLPIRHSGLPRHQARPAKASRGTSSPAIGRSW